MKKVPSDSEAEKDLLGAMMFNREVISDVADILSSNDFFHEINGIIFKAIVDLDNKSITPDLITMSNTIPKYSKDIPITYIAQLINGAATSANALHYAGLIKEKSILRQLIIRQTNIINRIYDDDFDTAQELLSDAEKNILEINDKQQVSIIHVRNVLIDYLIDLENLKPGINGLRTPFKSLDFITCGFQNKDLILIAARPGAGKTSLATEIIGYSVINGLSVAFFSIEMPKEQILNRIFAQQAHVPLKKFRMGGISTEEWDRVNRFSSKLSDCNLIIEDKLVTTLDIKSKCRRIKKQYGLDLIVIDYMQKIRGHKKAENRNHELGAISGDLKDIAKELNVPLISLAQLSRAVDSRADKKPQMSDLRDSGNLEQDADMICFLYNDEYYNPNTEKKGITDLIISKHRNGEVGTIELGWNRAYTKLYDLNSSFSAEQLFAAEA